jgi:hypothetical protein
VGPGIRACAFNFPVWDVAAAGLPLFSVLSAFCVGKCKAFINLYPAFSAAADAEKIGMNVSIFWGFSKAEQISFRDPTVLKTALA